MPIDEKNVRHPCGSCGVPDNDRRRFVGQALGLMAMPLMVSRLARAGTEPKPQNAISADAALTRLQEGNARYAADALDVKNFSVGRSARVKAQYPIAALLSCADSRVAPELIFDQGPGDLFVIRVAGNYLSGSSLASLEYAVAVLNVPLIMVLGHTECGAVKSTISALQGHTPLPGHIWDIVDAVRPGVEKAVSEGGADLANRAVAANVRYNVSRIAGAQPIVAEAVLAGRVKVVGGVYELSTGKVQATAAV
jgi:carbonic anhydrase